MYAVSIERVDTSVYFSSPTDLPNFIQSAGFLGCIAPLAIQQREYWDGAEGATELAQAYTPITIPLPPNQAVPTFDFVVGSVGLELVMREQELLQGSSRSVRVAPTNALGQPNSVVVEVLGLQANAGAPYALFVGSTRNIFAPGGVITPINGQLFEMANGTAFSGLLDPVGNAQATLPISGAYAFENFRMQAAIFTANSGILLTNTANLWVESR